MAFRVAIRRALVPAGIVLAIAPSHWACSSFGTKDVEMPEPKERVEVSVALRFEEAPDADDGYPATDLKLVLIHSTERKEVHPIATARGVCQHRAPRPLDIVRAKCGWLDEASLFFVQRKNDELLIYRGEPGQSPVKEVLRVDLPEAARLRPLRPDA